MRITTEINPPWISASTYVDFLNRVYPKQWDRASFEWYLRRPFNGRGADIVVRSCGGTLLASMAIAHRQVDDGTGRPVAVGVISGAATLPCERGRGHYAELLKTGIDLGIRAGYTALLGFTTRENPSARGLMRLGAQAIPSFYLVSAPRSMGSAPRSPPCPSSRRARPRGWEWGAARPAITRPHAGLMPRHREHDGALRFRYERAQDWEDQFIARPNPVRAIRLRHDSVALLETVGSTDRLQWLDCPARTAVASIRTLARASAAAGRIFFMYTQNPADAAAAARLGLRLRAGLLNVLTIGPPAAAAERLRTMPWRLQSGDRI
jgi:hypothetical protein